MENLLILELPTSDAPRGCNTRELGRQIAALMRESAEGQDRLRQRLHSLALRVSSRFAEEEQSEWYEAAICRSPWLTARAQELRRQHVELIETLRGILELCSRSDGPAACRLELRRRFDEFLELWQEHEQAESELLREAYEPTWTLE